jgi:Tfp pilus assembly pilus retraction ATPase PilT
MNQRLLRRRSGGRVAIREICLHAPKVEAVILKGNEQELVSYMLSGRETGMIDFQSALKAMQGVIDPQEFLLHRR